MTYFQFDQDIQDLLKMDRSLQITPQSIRRSKSMDRSLTPRNNVRTTTMTTKSQIPVDSCVRVRLRSQSKTPSRLMNALSTVTRITTTGGDRFIPNRTTTDLNFAQYAIKRASCADEIENENLENVDPNRADLMNRVLGNEKDENKILSFKDKTSETGGNQCRTSKVFNGANPTSKPGNQRHISTKPIKVLDAPELEDDFYLHLADWSKTNHMAVILSSDIFIWDATNGSIVELTKNQSDFTCVSWEGTYLAAADTEGVIQLWDAHNTKLLRTMTGHTAAVGVIDWNSHILSSGGRSGTIHFHDVRVQEHIVETLLGHTQEVCGLDWSPDGKLLASGGNDNVVQIWDSRHLRNPLHTLTEHQSAIKAVKWCPWSNTTLATGGGRADCKIRIWNVINGTCMKHVNSGSQISSIVWNGDYKELMTGHGFSHNQLTVWKYSSLTKITDIKGHTSRVLSLVKNPDGSIVASVAADETIRLWSIWPKRDKRAKLCKRPRAHSSSMFRNIR